jgi:branched-chain amino acid transport system ATP-binding protein
VSPPLLDIEGISSGYGKQPVLHAVSMRVEEGEVVSIIGPNGAGKSTVLKTVLGFLRPQEGRISLAGQEITGRRADRLVPLGLAYVPQGRIVFQDMTVLENLEMGAYTVRDRRALLERLDLVFEFFPRLAERRTQLAGTMSGGEQQMLAMGRALMVKPRLLMMDEPSLGLAPKFVDFVFDIISRFRELDLTVLMVEQNAARALASSDRAYVLELGRNRLEGAGRELLVNPEVKRLYLGG